jgi:hypothetical protein
LGLGFFARVVLQVFGIALSSLADELGLTLEVSTARTQHDMHANRQAFAKAEFFVQALRNQGSNFAATTHDDFPFLISMERTSGFPGIPATLIWLDA